MNQNYQTHKKDIAERVKAAQSAARKVTANKKVALAFLKEAGIVTKNGNVSPKFK